MPTRKIVIAREKKHSTPSSSPPLLIIGRVTEMEHGKNSWSLASSFISSVHNVPFTSYGGPFINSTPSVDPVPSPARIMHKRRQENGATKNPITRTCLCVYIFFFFANMLLDRRHTNANLCEKSLLCPDRQAISFYGDRLMANVCVFLRICISLMSSIRYCSSA